MICFIEVFLFNIIVFDIITWTISAKCGVCTVQCSYISFSVLFQTKSSLVWKSYTQKLCTIFQTDSSLVWKEKIDFARRRFQTKFRLVWKILMTIVNVLKIPNQIQFGLEKSLTIKVRILAPCQAPIHILFTVLLCLTHRSQ